MKKSESPALRRGDRRRSPITFLTQDETKRLFSAIKSKRDRAQTGRLGVLWLATA